MTQEISYFRSVLEQFLNEHHPDRVNDTSFIVSRAEEALDDIMYSMILNQLNEFRFNFNAYYYNSRQFYKDAFLSGTFYFEQ